MNIKKLTAAVLATATSATLTAAVPEITGVTMAQDFTRLVTINYTLSRAEGENVGEYAITVTLGENPNYDVTVTNAKLTIGKKAATVTAADKSKTYGEADPELTATVDGKTICLVVHDLNTALTFADKLIVLCGGTVVAEGAPASIASSGIIDTVFGVRTEHIPLPDGKKLYTFVKTEHNDDDDRRI